MLSEKFLDRVGRLIDVGLAERRKQLPMEIMRVKSEFSARGVLHSSMYVLKIKELCEREIEIRTAIIWRSMVRILRAGAEEYGGLSDALKRFIYDQIDLAFDELTGILSQNLMGMMTLDKVPLDDARNHAIATHDIEIDLFVDSLTFTEDGQASAASSATNYNFYGSVGAVQTGDKASASIVQNLGASDVDAIRDALALARGAMLAATEIGERPRTELINVIDEATGELSSATPNSTKLNSLLLTIATTIQTMASAKPAYQALKGALLPLGITLP